MCLLVTEAYSLLYTYIEKDLGSSKRWVSWVYRERHHTGYRLPHREAAGNAADFLYRTLRKNIAGLSEEWGWLNLFVPKGSLQKKSNNNKKSLSWFPGDFHDIYQVIVIFWQVYSRINNKWHIELEIRKSRPMMHYLMPNRYVLPSILCALQI